MKVLVLSFLFMLAIRSSDVFGSGLVYSNSFTGVSGGAISAEVDPGLDNREWKVQLDGSGHMVSTQKDFSSALRIKLQENPISDSIVKLTAVLKTPPYKRHMGRPWLFRKRRVGGVSLLRGQ
jgi:hypothetical protein